ncbi:hypothetical protein FKW77_007177 [Venturia effusa]|uniref:Uncharacterized protein n=1 Tax=Venturia effusa TaxID=50376 RepID=A0A517L3N3_9PEZI|nr:hypothetical protein FKW77_007177 [Venturia effusa]
MTTRRERLKELNSLLAARKFQKPKADLDCPIVNAIMLSRRPTQTPSQRSMLQNPTFSRTRSTSS